MKQIVSPDLNGFGFNKEVAGDSGQKRSRLRLAVKRKMPAYSAAENDEVIQDVHFNENLRRHGIEPIVSMMLWRSDNTNESQA